MTIGFHKQSRVLCKCSKNAVIASQCAHWRGNPFPSAQTDLRKHSDTYSLWDTDFRVVAKPLHKQSAGQRPSANPGAASLQLLRLNDKAACRYNPQSASLTAPYRGGTRVRYEPQFAEQLVFCYHRVGPYGKSHGSMHCRGFIPVKFLQWADTGLPQRFPAESDARGTRCGTWDSVPAFRLRSDRRGTCRCVPPSGSALPASASSRRPGPRTRTVRTKSPPQAT